MVIAPENDGSVNSARIEKYAQSHLDRIHAITSGATKTALAWLVALLLVWVQLIEPKLDQVRAAQTSRRELGVTATLGLERLAQAQRFRTDENIAGAQQIELPFSIKIALPPEWVPTLWLAMALGLSWYLVDTRRRVLTLAARGVRLLAQINTGPLYTRSVAGSAIWWLSPLPAGTGREVESAALRRALGWGRRNRAGTAILSVCAALFLLAETRVFYLGFCISSYLRGIDRSGAIGPVYRPSAWFVVMGANFALVAGTALALWAWFGPETVPDHMPDDADREPAVRIDRRRLLAHIRAASALVASAAIWESLSVYAQAASPKRRTAAAAMPPRRSHRPRHKKRKNTPIPKLEDGLYLNVKTGTVHAATSQCTTCLIATHPQSLVPTKADDVHWNGRRASASLESVPLRAIANNKPPSAVRLVAAQTTAAVPGPAARQEPHPHAEHRVFMIERHALDLITRGDYLRGAAVLMEAAQSTPTFGLNSNMRLYDLLAGVSVRYALDGHRATLVHNLERELQNVRSLERIAQPARGSAVVSYLYDLAGNDFVHAAAPDNPRPKRSHKPHHHSPKMPGSSASVRAPDSKPKNLPHATYIQRIAADRMAKWRLPIEQVNKTRWGQFWTQPGPIQWAGVQLPALKAAKG